MAECKRVAKELLDEITRMAEITVDLRQGVIGPKLYETKRGAIEIRLPGILKRVLEACKK